MGRGLDLLRQIYLLDDAVLVDHEGGAEGAHVLASVHALLAPHAHGLHQLLVGVGNQGEGQFVLVDKLAVRGGTVYTHANHFVAPGTELAVVVAQLLVLGCDGVDKE